MSDYSSIPKIFPKEYIIEHGVMYDEDIFYSDDYESGILYDRDPLLGGKPFSGILYELDRKGILRYYKFYKDGVADGEYVTFYDTGKVSSYSTMKGFGFIGKSYRWYRNGVLESIYETDQNQKYTGIIKYDENGNVSYESKHDT